MKSLSGFFVCIDRLCKLYVRLTDFQFELVASIGPSHVHFTRK